jgi:hypothetical protein
LFFSALFTTRIASPALALAALVVASCASVAPSSPPAGPLPGPFAAPPSAADPGPANINLQGFPLEYRQGYADGCASASGAERKVAARYASDGQYRTGWQDGNALCKRR